jgi:hypothetical protein
MESGRTGPGYVDLEAIRVWAGKLAGEARGEEWVKQWYVVPEVLVRIVRELEAGRYGGLIGLFGSQGVGKSSALLALCNNAAGELFSKKYVPVLFKWRREPELYASLLNGTHEVSEEFLPKYLKRLLDEIRSDTRTVRGGEHIFVEREQELERLSTEGYIDPDSSVISWAESVLGSAVCRKLRRAALYDVLTWRDVILIDTPDYSKTDRRRMAKDLDSIYWLWSEIAHATTGPNLVVAIQKELSHGHFFLDKMQRFEIEPLPAEKMVEAYLRRFHGPEPFTQSALLRLAQISRGIFRRFLRYLTLTMDFWDTWFGKHGPIDVEVVERAVPFDRVAEDMELELLGLFPKHSDLRQLAVRVLMELQRSGGQRQSELVGLMDVEPYALSRLLTRLEGAHYITRTRSGTDKLVTLPSTEPSPQPHLGQ